MSNVEAPITSHDFRSGPLRGTHLTLFPHSFVHRGGKFLETIPMRGIAAVRVAFARDESKLGWGAALVAISLILFAIAGPMATLAGAAANEVATQIHGGQGVGGAVVSVFLSLQSFAHALPVVAVALLLWAAALFALGWYGMTTLTLTLGAVERDYAERGRSTLLYQFAEVASERLLSAVR